MSSDQREPFLAEYGSDGEDLNTERGHRTYRRPNYWSWKYSILIHGALVLFYTIVSIIVVKRSATAVCKKDTQIRENTIAVEFKSKPTLYRNLSMTPYAGDKPKEDLDTAWEKLMKPMNMRFTKSELDLVNQDSVYLPEGGGYLGWFGVFHNLHCVKLLRHSFERARQCNSTEEESKKDKGHVDHCIELLRQASVCQPDTSLTTFIWHPSTNLPMFNVSESVHSCVDWDAFMETTKKRVVGDEEMDRLKNPLFGGR